ncbi:MAG TPA: hypothetical protein VGC68_09450 [Enterovirga sp.]
MPDGRPQEEAFPAPPKRKAADGQDCCEIIRRASQALDRTYAMLLETLQELEAACESQPAPAG